MLKSCCAMVQRPRKYELLQRRREIARAYARAVNALGDITGRATVEEWGARYARAEHARLDMERARLEYQNHAEEHGC